LPPEGARNEVQRVEFYINVKRGKIYINMKKGEIYTNMKKVVRQPIANYILVDHIDAAPPAPRQGEPDQAPRQLQ
jgi:hypothetical protein